MPRVPTTKMKTLARLLEEVGHEDVSPWTSAILDLRDYQYHRPDPDMALSRYTTRQEAAADVVATVREIVRRVEALKSRVKWTDELGKALEELKAALLGVGVVVAHSRQGLPGSGSAAG